MQSLQQSPGFNLLSFYDFRGASTSDDVLYTKRWPQPVHGADIPCCFPGECLAFPSRSMEVIASLGGTTYQPSVVMQPCGGPAVHMVLHALCLDCDRVATAALLLLHSLRCEPGISSFVVWWFPPPFSIVSGALTTAWDVTTSPLTTQASTTFLCVSVYIRAAWVMIGYDS